MTGEFSPNVENLGKMAQHFNVAAHRQFFHRVQGLHTRRNHARAGDADKLQIGPACPERFNQMSTEQIAGGFARNQTYRYRSGRCLPMRPHPGHPRH